MCVQLLVHAFLKPSDRNKKGNTCMIGRTCVSGPGVPEKVDGGLWVVEMSGWGFKTGWWRLKCMVRGLWVVETRSWMGWVGLCWPLLAVVGLCWPSLACVGLRWPSLVVVGLRWPSLAFVGLRWPDKSNVSSKRINKEKKNIP